MHISWNIQPSQHKLMPLEPAEAWLGLGPEIESSISACQTNSWRCIYYISVNMTTLAPSGLHTLRYEYARASARGR